MSSIKRFLVERKEGFRNEAKQLTETLRKEVGLSALTGGRIFVRYDIAVGDQGMPETVQHTILSEPRTDDVYLEHLPESTDDAVVFAVEALPGQYDQRADSCGQCIELLTGARPPLKTAMVYAFYGNLSNTDVARIKDYLVNPVEARLASLEKPISLEERTPEVEPVRNIDGFIDMDIHGLQALKDEAGLAMDLADLKFMQAYFQQEKRNPTETELKVIDTYWSDHCRHTTFNTHLEDITLNDAAVRDGFEEYKKIREFVYPDAHRTRPVTLMDLGTIATKYLKKTEQVTRLDESEEINACSVQIDVETTTGKEPWLFMFKNETHNHPTEIEPFGGAATCLGGAIRDPLSGRSYVYQGMRLTGAADPRRDLNDTLPGKLPQRRICTLAADGFASYGNQIGLATGLVDEVYHPGYEAKRMEVGAVIAAAPKENVVRAVPAPGDVVVLIGGRTGRDGCGGATGSSKTHTESSLETSGAEVQKGNPVEERKIQRLFRRPEVAKVIRRCNDFGAGGVSVAIGELADGVHVNLDTVPKKYAGLNGTELAISESQERMACVIAEADWELFAQACAEENLEATIVAKVTKEPRLVMDWRGQRIVDLSRSFVDSAGAPKHMTVEVDERILPAQEEQKEDFLAELLEKASDLNVCSKRGLNEQFDSSIGAGTVLMPYGGKNQMTPIQAMAAKIPVLEGETNTASLFAYGFDPHAASADPFMGAYNAVVESVCKLIASGTTNRNVYLSLQEYFHSLRDDPKRWGKPFQSVLGALLAQLDLRIPAIGGKDSMSGSFEEMDVPPTLISFAATVSDAARIIGPEFKAPDHQVSVLTIPRKENGRVDPKAFDETWQRIQDGIAAGQIKACWAIGRGGLAEALIKMCVGNDIGVSLNGLAVDKVCHAAVGSFVIESTEPLSNTELIGTTSAEPVICCDDQKLSLDELKASWEAPLEGVYRTRVSEENNAPLVAPVQKSSLSGGLKIARPRVLIPVFPGTNCEFDTTRAFERVGAIVKTHVIANLTPNYLKESVASLQKEMKETQILVLPGGFSFGDEPNGSGKFIAAFFREESLKEAIETLLDKQDGLILGICNGFQALVKLGLLPYGEIIDPLQNDCTLTFNNIGRHQSKYVQTKIISNASPWLAGVSIGDIHSVPISHGEGRFIASENTLEQLALNGQIATQYVDASGQPSMDIAHNPNGSTWAIEGLISTNGRILGKMGHSERNGCNIAKNIPGNKDQLVFQNGVRYFTD